MGDAPVPYKRLTIPMPTQMGEELKMSGDFLGVSGTEYVKRSVGFFMRTHSSALDGTLKLVDIDGKGVDVSNEEVNSIILHRSNVYTPDNPPDMKARITLNIAQPVVETLQLEAAHFGMSSLSELILTSLEWSQSTLTLQASGYQFVQVNPETYETTPLRFE